MGRQRFLEPEELLGRQERKSSYEGPYHVVRKMVWGVFSDRGRRTTNWLGPWKGPSKYGCYWKGMWYVKLPCQNRQYKYPKYWRQFYRGNNFYNYNKKITIKIVTLVKLFLKAPWCRRCQHRTHRNRTPPLTHCFPCSFVLLFSIVVHQLCLLHQVRATKPQSFVK